MNKPYTVDLVIAEYRKEFPHYVKSMLTTHNNGMTWCNIHCPDDWASYSYSWDGSVTTYFFFRDEVDSILFSLSCL